jgi:hypothetical protein
MSFIKVWFELKNNRIPQGDVGGRGCDIAELDRSWGCWRGYGWGRLLKRAEDRLGKALAIVNGAAFGASGATRRTPSGDWRGRPVDHEEG